MEDFASRLQKFICAKAATDHQICHVGSFTLHIHPSKTDLDLNFAIPDTAVVNELVVGLDAMCATFVQHGCIPSVQFVEAFTPGLADVLQAAGFHETAREEILACTVSTYRLARPLTELTFMQLSQDSPLRDVKEGLDANALGFDPQASRATEAEAVAFRQDLVTSRAFTAKLGDQPVGAGMFTALQEGISELVGITTLAPFRRRGIAAALTSEMIRVAFDFGVDTIILHTDNPIARRVYTRIGFRPAATVLTHQRE